jgi:hypothetical protein
MREDDSGPSERAQKTFVTRDRDAKIVFQGRFSERPLAELFAEKRAGIVKETPNANVSLAVLGQNSFVLSWSVGQRISYLKLWRTAPGELVIARFEYPLRDRARFDEIIPHVLAGMTTTTPP